MGENVKLGNSRAVERNRTENRDEEQIDKGGLTATWHHVMSGPVLPPRTKCGSVSLPQLESVLISLGHIIHKVIQCPMIWVHTWANLDFWEPNWYQGHVATPEIQFGAMSGSIALLQPSSVIMSVCVTIKGLQNSWGLDYHLRPCWCPTSTLPLGSYLSEWHLMPFRFIRISGNTLKLRAISRSMVLLKLRSVLLSALNVTTSP